MAESITLARPYANAAFAHAKEREQLAPWMEALSRLAQAVQDPALAEVIAAPELQPEGKAQLLADIAGYEDQHFGNFLRLLAENRRLPLLAAIAELFSQLKAKQEQVVEVSLVSAYPLDDATADKLASTINKHFPGQVKLAIETDRSLIGGLIFRSGDTVIDGSVRGRLAKLAEAMNA